MNGSSLLLLLFPLLTVSLLNAAPAVAGKWRTIDDETGKTKSIVHIYETASGAIEGKVVEILHSDRGPNPVCDKCKGERKDQPIKGMVILWGLEEASPTSWKGGEILDPTKGKIYKAKLKLRDDGKLEVRGFIGFSLLGRTQVWEPVEG